MKQNLKRDPPSIICWIIIRSDDQSQLVDININAPACSSLSRKVVLCTVSNHVVMPRDECCMSMSTLLDLVHRRTHRVLVGSPNSPLASPGNVSQSGVILYLRE